MTREAGDNALAHWGPDTSSKTATALGVRLREVVLNSPAADKISSSTLSDIDC